ncbi:MAG: M23 family metallopeptidase [Verrucomicrobia bacterium]|nr:M23 family metallopeptidase [Verrucomicrobiota bacterium]
MKTALLGLTVFGWFAITGAAAPPFRFPTANQALLEPGGEARFFVGTAGSSWTSGTFGCVRSGGSRVHEGIDIRAVSRDPQGEPLDPVWASAEGVVVHVSRHSGLSNYGKYVVLRHRIEGLEVLTLYAHLSEIRAGLKNGVGVKSGEVLGRMGRTTNTRERISKDRAHLHFEVDLLASPRFAEWFRKHLPGQTNDHGLYNGRNLLGLDPRWLFLAQAEHGHQFSLLRFLRSQPMMFRVRLRDAAWAWAQRQPALVQWDRPIEPSAIAGYDVWFNFNGVPFKSVPRTQQELGPGTSVEVLEVNQDERLKHPCRQLVRKEGARWVLAPAGLSLLDLLRR